MTTKSLSRVVWFEGMHLGPHHFQAQSHYFEDSIQFAVSALWPNAWGLTGCEIDSAALRNGTLSVLHCRGAFPDGLIFNMPESDALPAPLAIGDLFPATLDKLTVSLAVPARRQNGQNTALNETPNAALNQTKANGFRYTAETYSLIDETTGRDEKAVRLGRKNIRLTPDFETTKDEVSIDIARLMRTGSGHFECDPTFIPPSLRVTASERLVLILQRLIEIMQDKSASLEQRFTGNQQAFSARELATYWFTHCVNTSLPPLQHLCFAKHSHPEEVWLELSRLAGALFTFALESHPRSLPLYNHARLDECFAAIDQVIRTHLNLVVPTNSIRIPLERTAESFWTGEVRDRRAFDRADWLLAVHSTASMTEVIERTPRLVKICSRDFVPKLVSRALPGLALTYLPSPPAAISPSVETQYFSITKAGPCWDHIRQSAYVGVYIPENIPAAEPELIVVLDHE